MARTLPPPAAADASLADYALVAYYGDLENPTLVIANLKTHERFRLKVGDTAAPGFVIRACQLSGPVEQKFIDVTKDGISSRLNFAQAYVRQRSALIAGQGGGSQQEAPSMPNGRAPASAAAPQQLTAQVSSSIPAPMNPGALLVASARPGPAGLHQISQAPEMLPPPSSDQGTDPNPVSQAVAPVQASASARRVLIPPVAP